MHFYFLESIHGVVVDVLNSLKEAQELQQERGGFRSTPRRIFFIEAGRKKYL